jgi:hypothetical protein
MLVGARFALTAAVALALGTPLARAQEALDVAAYQREAGTLFSPESMMADARFAAACDGVLLIFQAASVLVIVAGMIIRICNHQEQMEGIASVLIKVAFIATVPFWRDFVIETADLAASAIGHRPACAVDPPAASVTAVWNLFGQWAPPSSAALDSLDTQAATPPVSGDEVDWSTKAWNWASGLAGAAGGSQPGWAAFAGGLRGAIVLSCCGIVASCLAFTLALTYFVEAFRLVLFYAGCALLPVFLAGLSLDSLRAQSVKFVTGLIAVGFWPVGWGIANVATSWVAGAVLSWMRGVSAAAAGVNVAGTTVPPLASCASSVAWGALFLFAGITVAVVVWNVASLLIVPIVLGRLTASGGQAARMLVGGVASVRASAPPQPPRGAVAGVLSAPPNSLVPVTRAERPASPMPRPVAGFASPLPSARADPMRGDDSRPRLAIARRFSSR